MSALGTSDEPGAEPDAQHDERRADRSETQKNGDHVPTTPPRAASRPMSTDDDQRWRRATAADEQQRPADERADATAWPPPQAARA